MLVESRLAWEQIGKRLFWFRLCAWWKHRWKNFFNFSKVSIELTLPTKINWAAPLLLNTAREGRRKNVLIWGWLVPGVERVKLNFLFWNVKSILEHPTCTTVYAENRTYQRDFSGGNFSFVTTEKAPKIFGSCFVAFWKEKIVWTEASLQTGRHPLPSWTLFLFVRVGSLYFISKT